MSIPDSLKAALSFITSSGVLSFVAVLSVAMLLASVFAIPWLVCRLPEDYLCGPGSSPTHSPATGRWASPLLRRTIRNAIGAVLVLFGVIMLVLPGQGLLTILVGLTLLDFPQKRRFILRLFSRPRVLAVLNSIRRRLDHPPLRTPSSSDLLSD